MNEIGEEGGRRKEGNSLATFYCVASVLVGEVARIGNCVLENLDNWNNAIYLCFEYKNSQSAGRNKLRGRFTTQIFHFLAHSA